jgi:hypothetical protein
LREQSFYDSGRKVIANVALLGKQWHPARRLD